MSVNYDNCCSSEYSRKHIAQARKYVLEAAIAGSRAISTILLVHNRGRQSQLDGGKAHCIILKKGQLGTRNRSRLQM